MAPDLAMIETAKAQGRYHKELWIGHGERNVTYDKIFGRILDDSVGSVQIFDPFIRSYRQIQYLTEFCEVLVHRCPNLRSIELITKLDDEEGEEKKENKQEAEFAKIMEDLWEGRFRIKFSFKYDPELHDREVRFDHGWRVKLGRGLELFQPTGRIGKFKQELRECKKCSIDFFYHGEQNRRPANLATESLVEERLRREESYRGQSDRCLIS